MSSLYGRACGLLGGVLTASYTEAPKGDLLTEPSLEASVGEDL